MGLSLEACCLLEASCALQYWGRRKRECQAPRGYTLNLHKEQRSQPARLLTPNLPLKATANVHCLPRARY